LTISVACRRLTVLKHGLKHKNSDRLGPAGAREFFRLFAELLEPGEFNITASFSEGEHVCMYGKLRHRSRTTGRDFPSNWALICRVQQGRLSLYHFYEDTAALEAAIA